MAVYLSTIRDHISKKEHIISKSKTYENAMLFNEEYIEDFIHSKQGSEIKIGYFSEQPLQNGFKEGCYVKNKNYPRCSICERIRDIGIFYNGFHDIKLYTLSIVEYKVLDDKSNLMSIEIKERADILHKFEATEKYNLLMEELKTNYCEEISN